MAARRGRGVSGAEFRRLALALPDTVAGEHMQHPDFRAGGRIFATLRADETQGMVKVTPAEQQRLLREHAAAFTACSGAWGRAGCTSVQLDAVSKAVLQAALTAAWERAMAEPAKPRAKKRR